jgi:tetratricopeptide (TPR) repeat protein
MTRMLLLLLAFVTVTACSRAAGDAELAGDRAYGAGRFAAASEQYQAALGHEAGGRLRAKAGAAALHAGDLRRAAADYARLAADDPTRLDEAADGLARVAHAAELAGDSAALGSAVLTLSGIAPARITLRQSLLVARNGELPPVSALVILPRALAVADAPAVVDSLLLRYGGALDRAAACEDAVLAYRAVERRSADSGLRRAALVGRDGCALRLGLTALTGGRPADAARWFDGVTSHDSVSWTGRRAWIGLGDVRRLDGDTAGAAAAFRAAAAQGGDSLSQLAAGRLDALAQSQSQSQSQSAGDTARTSAQ